MSFYWWLKNWVYYFQIISCTLFILNFKSSPPLLRIKIAKMKTLPQIAILDDYQNVAFSFGDWSTIRKNADVTVFNHHMASQEEVVHALQPFQVVCVMRERTPLSREILSSLPNLKLIVSTGRRNASIDMI